MSKTRVIIVHGFTGNPDKNWFPWLKKELETADREIEVLVPAMPDPEHPLLPAWLSHLTQIASPPDEHLYFVGHSLGCIAILRYLERLPASQVVGGAVLVAGFSQPIAIEETDNFFNPSLDYENVRCSVQKIVAINSDNDPHVPLAQGKILQDRLGADLLIYPNGGHLNEKSGFTAFPLVLEQLNRMI